NWNTEELVYGVYLHAMSALDSALEKYMAETNPLTDAPSRRVLRFARLELADMRKFGEQAFASLIEDEITAVWKGLDACRGAAGGLDGTVAESGTIPEPFYSKKPYEYDPVPKRDERFSDPWNQGVNAESFLYSEKYPARTKALMMLYKRLREIDVPEM